MVAVFHLLFFIFSHLGFRSLIFDAAAKVAICLCPSVAAAAVLVLRAVVQSTMKTLMMLIDVLGAQVLPPESGAAATQVLHAAINQNHNEMVLLPLLSCVQP